MEDIDERLLVKDQGVEYLYSNYTLETKKKQNSLGEEETLNFRKVHPRSGGAINLHKTNRYPKIIEKSRF